MIEFDYKWIFYFFHFSFWFFSHWFHTHAQTNGKKILYSTHHHQSSFQPKRVASSRWVMLETLLLGAILLYLTVNFVLFLIIDIYICEWMMMINVQDDYSTCINLMNRIWIQNLNKKKFIFFFFLHSFISHSSFCDHGCMKITEIQKTILFSVFSLLFSTKKKFLLFSFFFPILFFAFINIDIIDYYYYFLLYIGHNTLSWIKYNYLFPWTMVPWDWFRFLLWFNCY